MARAVNLMMLIISFSTFYTFSKNLRKGKIKDNDRLVVTLNHTLDLSYFYNRTLL